MQNDTVVVAAEDVAAGGLAYHGLRDIDNGLETSYQIRENKSERIPLLQNRSPSEDGYMSRHPPDDGSHLQDQCEGDAYRLGLPWWKRPSIYWLLPPFLLWTLSWGGVIVPKLNLILSLICRQYLADRSLRDPSFQFMPVLPGAENPQCQIPEVQALVARFQLYANLIPGILGAITSPKLGALSDRYGRTRVIAASLIGAVVCEIITIMAATWPDDVSVYWLFVGYVLDGLCGSFIAAMALVNSYVADCTPPAKRNETFGFLHGTLFTGIAVGPILAGYIIEATGTPLSIFYIMLACQFIFLSVMLLVIPESLSKERQMIAREKHLADKEGEEPWSIRKMAKSANVFVPLDVLYPTGEGSSRAVRMNLVLLAAVDTTMFGVAMGSMSVVILYSEYVFHWGNLQSSIFMSVVNTSRVFMLLVVLPLISRLFRARQGQAAQRKSGSDLLDLAIIRVAVLFDTMGYIGYTLARTGSVFIASGAMAAVGGIGSPALQSALTKHVPPDRTGQLLGALGLLHALARVVAPTIFNLIYSVTVGTCPQIVFVCLTSTFALAFLLSWFIKPHVYWDDVDSSRSSGVFRDDLAEDD
ncbi:MAG: hypothetical protein M1816_007604 [Peltula sp. TS41687]|nr:MAG: hypothetical protein M1816_007604 [Peltula sp. TS41687]